MIWVKGKEDPGVDIFNITQKVQDTVIHLMAGEDKIIVLAVREEQLL